MNAALPLTGQPGILTWYDWTIRRVRRAYAVRLGRPDDPALGPTPDAALEPEPWERDEGRPEGYAFGELQTALILCLANYGRLSVRELAELTGARASAVTASLLRRPDLFTRTGKKRASRWQLASGDKARGGAGSDGAA